MRLRTYVDLSAANGTIINAPSGRMRSASEDETCRAIELMTRYEATTRLTRNQSYCLLSNEGRPVWFRITNVVTTSNATVTVHYQYRTYDRP